MEDEERLLEVERSEIDNGVQRLLWAMRWSQVMVEVVPWRSHDGDPGMKIVKECCWISDIIRVWTSKKLTLRSYEEGKWCNRRLSPPPGIMVLGLKEEKDVTERAPREVS